MEATQTIFTQVSQYIDGTNLESVESFCKSLFPVLSNSSLPEKLITALHTYMVINLVKDKTFEVVIQEVQNKCKDHVDLIEPIKKLFSDEAFLSKFKTKVMGSV